MTAVFIVRAEVPEADRTAFDRWYETEHLPDAMAAFGTVRARRGWSEIDPGIHVALYEFATLAEAQRIAAGDASPEIQALIAEFDRVWQGRVTRTREIVGISQMIDA
ncbi:MAG: hypothetical protein AAFV19_13005 [Pseudomonadota bacterium]